MQATRFILHADERLGVRPNRINSVGFGSASEHFDLNPNVSLSILGSGWEVLKQDSRWLISIGRFSRAEARSHLVSCLRDYSNPSRVLEKAREMPGSFHLVYSDPSTTIAQGPASGSRQTFYSVDDNQAFVGNRAADISDALGKTGPDTDFLCLGLIHPLIDYGLTRRTHWKSVKRLFAQERFTWSRKSGTVVDEYWHAPARSKSIEEVAPRLRSELFRSLSTFQNSENRITSDLSGGMDSTSLCCLMTESGIDYRAYVEEIDDPDHSDASWATRVASEIGADLHIIRPEDFPRPYQLI